MKLNAFKNDNFIGALKAFFRELEVPVNYVTDQPTTGSDLLKDTWKDNESFGLIENVYFLGMVDDSAFQGNSSLRLEQIKSDYDGILIFGITLKDRQNGLLPTRAQLAEIARAFNREFYYTPVVIVFRYAGHLAFANTERIKYKQEWREGEKAGKVTLLRDIDIETPHSGHERILAELKVPTSGPKKVDSFAKLYVYWQDVFSVNILNKRFYQELSSWYFWAIKNVTFPGEPTNKDAFQRKAKIEDLVQEHNATNVIRLLTRLLFVWFIKEKKLIPEELFDLETLQKDILKEISPFHDEGMFKDANKHSVYYKAILQNLFFATLNCPIEADSLDKRQRAFRGEGYGTHRGIDYLMRYKQYFKNPERFLEQLNRTVPFLNGGLFECLDDKFNNVYVDGFSDQMAKGEQLIVPDYLFFGSDERADLSDIVGIADKKYKNAAVKGLINILKSYKFTITENTPIEEDVALDPELLGKVFENLLASYNPETKTTARKQTGSFYTPREIVNYMVDESIISYLKDAVTANGLTNTEFEDELRKLTSFDNSATFTGTVELRRNIIEALSSCSILDPACGSGAFPMGVLQKMVNMLQKLDADNAIWKEVQLQKAEQESKEAFEILDKQAREERLLEINEAFDQSINDPDYARKLFLIENCIYGVDLQPIATQISKLRFFISLVVEQKVDAHKPNFGIRPLPNLETKFVTANTLVGISKPSSQLSFYDLQDAKKLESELKVIRHRLFSAKSKETKLKYRTRDEELRKAIAVELEKGGWSTDTARNLATWDPYSQNDSCSFFDAEWMFDISDGFDIVIGNPPYVFTRDVDFKGDFKKYIDEEYFSKMIRGKKSKSNQSGKINLFAIFIIKGLMQLKNKGYLSYIVPNNILRTTTYDVIRRFVLENSFVDQIVDLGSGVFDNVTASTVIIGLSNKPSNGESKIITEVRNIEKSEFKTTLFDQAQFIKNVSASFNIYMDETSMKISREISEGKTLLGDFCVDNIEGIVAHKHLISDYQDDSRVPLIEGKDIKRYIIQEPSNFLKWDTTEIHRTRPDYIWNAEQKIVIQRISGGKKPLVCAVDTKRYKTFASTNNILLKEKFQSQYYFIAALINSDVLNWFYANNFSNNSTLTVNISKTYMDELPIAEYSPTISFLSEVLHSDIKKNVYHEFTIIMNGLIYSLYFKQHMKERRIDILDIVEADLGKVVSSKSFLDLDEGDKLRVTEELYKKWTHPDSEIRNRIKLFAVRSPEILKPIIEA